MKKIENVRVIVCWNQDESKDKLECKLEFNRDKLVGKKPILREYVKDINILGMKNAENTVYGDMQKGVWVFDYHSKDASCILRDEIKDYKYLDCR